MPEDRQTELLSKAIEGGVTVIQTVGWTISAVVFAVCMEKVLIAFAGKTTNANVSLSLLTKLQADRWFAYLFGVGGMSYGFAERKLRQRNIKRMSRLNVDLEARLDRERKSSGLTPSGKTQRGD